ncbi:MAG: hypothetical protein AAGC55_11840, partial [Myxococcota bacterium]
MKKLFGRLSLSVIALGLVFTVGCGGDGAAEITECGDGVDNDGDGLIDGSDPGCELNSGFAETPDPFRTDCTNGEDDDGDGLIDLEDPGCLAQSDNNEFDEPIAQCADGEDNDGDGLIDFPYDPGCVLSLGGSEDDGCPSDPRCPACGNNLDDDGDGQIDYPDDLGCRSAADNDEYSPSVNECGTEVPLLDMPESGDALGTAISDGTNELVSACGGTGPETVFGLTVETPRALIISTDFPETTLDTVLYLREGCGDPSSELACNDDDIGLSSTLVVERIEPGQYYLVVDAHSSSANGDFRVQYIDYTPQGEECDPEAPDCTPGLECRFLDMKAENTTCEVPECQDGLDNDGDGLSDFPFDPGCTDADDNSESDGCPDGADCPQCGNGIDDDFDGLTDYPADFGCDSAADPDEVDECIPGVAVVPLTAAGDSGTTPPSSAGSNFTPGCNTSTLSTEVVYQYNLTRTLTSLTFSTEGSIGDTVLSVREFVCGDVTSEIACANVQNGGEAVTIPDPAPGFYYAFVDGDFVSNIDYTISVSGTLGIDEVCDPADSQFVCDIGLFCEPGTTTCRPTQCNDGTDNDGDGDSDFPDDPGCIDISDIDETDDCPDGASCPECGNGQDDDGDGLIDFPDDTGCESSSDNGEVDNCIPGVPVLELGDAGTSGTTPASSAGSNFTPSCNSSTLSTEVVYQYNLTRTLTSLTFSTEGSIGDTVL